MYCGDNLSTLGRFFDSSTRTFFNNVVLKDRNGRRIAGMIVYRFLFYFACSLQCLNTIVDLLDSPLVS
ncbi:hypothetical protein ABKN59_002550 [Abortiporus biennis]